MHPSNARLSPRQKYRLAAQQGILNAQSDFDVAIDLGVERGLSGRMLSTMAGRVFGVDKWGPALTETLSGPNRFDYDYLIEQDALTFLTAWRPVDGVDTVVLAAEILEHFEKERGKVLLGMIEEKATFAIVTTPWGWMPQGEIDGNPHQVHQSAWYVEDFEDRGWKVKVESQPHSLIVATWSAS